jgi:amino acid permease
MTTTAILLSWITICATYLRLRSAVKVQFMVLDAVSSFQPLLARYGLACSVVLGIPSFVKLIVAVLQGYVSFTRHGPLWGQSMTSWGYTMAPFIVIIGFFFLLVWSIVLGGEWTWRMQAKDQLDLCNGSAPAMLEYPRKESLRNRTIRRILDFI